MRCRWYELLVWGILLGPVQPLRAQGRELGIQAVGTASDPALAVAGVYGALRISGRTRLSAGLGAGTSDGSAAGRGELLAHFLLSPEELRRPGFYLAGGIAGVAGTVDRGFLVLTAGLEARPRSRSGWAVELGVGGGARLALGYRWRWFPGPTGQ